jgi:putative endonuclease
MTYQKQIGNKGEQMAADYLQIQGFTLLDMNFNTRYGELDLVMLDSESLVFVEVKTRTSADLMMPEESITYAKFERIYNAGLLWLQAHPDCPDDWRVDVVAILLDRQKNIVDLHHFANVTV